MRKAGDWVWLKPMSGFVSNSHRLKAEIQAEMEGEAPPPCFLCEDPDCLEWSNLWTEPDPKNEGKRWTLCHVSECQMLDEPYKENHGS